MREGVYERIKEGGKTAEGGEERGTGNTRLKLYKQIES